jgi:putative endonuclease
MPGAAASVYGEAMPHVYILRCSDGTFSVGSTIDLDRRIVEHNAGLGAAYTRRRLPVTLEGGLDAVIGWSARHRAGKRDKPGR